MELRFLCIKLAVNSYRYYCIFETLYINSVINDNLIFWDTYHWRCKTNVCKEQMSLRLKQFISTCIAIAKGEKDVFQIDRLTESMFF